MLEPGGHYHPQECQARDRVAIIVPYRDRAQHLSTLLLNLHPLLQRQQLDYGIFVVEQAGKYLCVYYESYNFHFDYCLSL